MAYVTSSTLDDMTDTLDKLLRQIRNCGEYQAHLPLGPRPILHVHPKARLLIIGQAPGTKVHESGIPWNDPSGDRLRTWLGLTSEEFYDETRIAIMPMGFCYPGKGTSGDLPPRPECAPLWHEKILANLPNIKLTLLIGQYAQERYLGPARKQTLTDTVRAWREYTKMRMLPLVHPSPRNQLWLKKNPWFEKDVVPYLREMAHQALKK